MAGVVAVPDRHDDGTNVLAVPTGSGFTFAYGPGSFARHRQEATRLGLLFTVLRTPELTWDVDLPDDLVATLDHTRTSAASPPAVRFNEVVDGATRTRSPEHEG